LGKSERSEEGTKTKKQQKGHLETDSPGEDGGERQIWSGWGAEASTISLADYFYVFFFLGFF